MSRYPIVTVLLWVVTSAVVAGVVEETSFRGYLQRPIERRHGPVIAILVTGTLFGLAHFAHPEVGVVLLPFYLAVAAVYGGLAYLTDSTLPGMVLHAGGNLFSALDLFTRGRSEWQLTPEAKPLIWETGPDAAFWGNVAALLIVSALTLWAYSTLARATRKVRCCLTTIPSVASAFSPENEPLATGILFIHGENGRTGGESSRIRNGGANC